MSRILIADDDSDIRSLLRDYLVPEGHMVYEAGSGPETMEAFTNEEPDLVILDVMMPGFDGLEACRRIRQQSQVPIIFLTARTDEIDQLLAFGFGADDYVAKPFSPRAMVARVKAQLRRFQAPSRRISFGQLVLDLDAFQVKVEEKELELTSKEFMLLRYFAERPGKVLTKRQLVTGAWGEEYFGDDSVLMVHLSHLRQKLGDAGSCLRTIRGVGYKFIGEEQP